MRLPWRRPRRGSFAAKLPYWQVLKVPLQRGPEQVAVLLLKDGTVCIGLRVAGLDVYTSSDQQLNIHADQLAGAFGDLPPEVCVQAIFESGNDFSDLLERFSAQTAQDAHELVRRGREQQRRALESDEKITRCSITYWVGWPGLAAKLRCTKRVAGQEVLTKAADFNAKELGRAADMLFTGVEQLKRGLEAVDGMSVALMSDQDMLGAIHRAVNPATMVEGAALGPRFIESEADRRLYSEGAPLLMKGFSLAAQLPLSSLKIEDAHLVTGDPPLLMRALGVIRLGPTTTMKALHEVMYRKMPHRPYRLVVTHQKTNRELSRESLEKQARVIKSFGKLAKRNAAASLALEENQELRDSLELGSVHILNTHITVLVTGRTHQELDDATRSVIAGLGEEGMVLTTLYDAQLAGWLATLPGHIGARKPNLTLTQRNAAHLLPYWLPSEGDPVPEILLRNRQRGLEGLSVRVGGGREHAGAIIVGAIGSGKTFLFIELLKYGILALGGHAVIVDKKGTENSSLAPLCALLGGAYFSIDGQSEVSFNPFPLRHEMYTDAGDIHPDLSEPLQLQLIMMAWGTLQGDGDAITKTKLASEAVKATYAACRDKSGPVLEDAVRVLGAHDFQSEKLQGLAKVMQEKLQWGWLDNPRRKKLFNRPGHVDLTNRLTVYDFFGAEGDPETQAVMMASLSSRVAMKMSKLAKGIPKLFAADEAWSTLAHSEEGAEMIHRLCRLQRSFEFCVMLLTQSYMDVVNNPLGAGILGSTSMIYLLKHLDGHKQVADLLDLNPQARHLFTSLEMRAGEFAEMLLFDKTYKKVRLARYCPTAFDLWWHTSRPADVKLRDMWMANSKNDFATTLEELARMYPHGAPTLPGREAA